MPRMKAAKKGSKRAGGGRRPAGEDLCSYITKVLSGKSPMGIASVAEAVRKSGYQSSSPAFVRIVGMRLSSDKRFKRAERGTYTLARGGKK